MEEIALNKNNPNSNAIKTITDYFQQRAIVTYPTDTVYGLGCIATEKKAIKRIYKIKKRPVDKPLLILIKDQQMLDEYFAVNEVQKNI